MASIILSTAGSAIGASTGSTFLTMALQMGGEALGNAIDNKIFGPKRLPDYEGPRLSDLSVQTSSYGKAVPVVFGTGRIAGNIIWSLPIKETAITRTETAGGKGGGGKAAQRQTTYVYSATLAIALCEGEVDEVARIWADAENINPNIATMRFYKGTEAQNPDPAIETHEGVGKAPAYRGLSYIVFEDFPLESYGNRIPNFTFEIKRKVQSGGNVSERVNSVVMMPGSGEFVYDTVVQSKIVGEEIDGVFTQTGKREPINKNNHQQIADAVASLDQLKADLPNTEWVSLVVGWFADSLDVGDATLKPGVEYNYPSETQPDEWGVAGFTRSTARLLSTTDGHATYGGTPSDASVVRLAQELKDRGYNVLFYPFVFVDTAGKPWRGRITGTHVETADFFTKADGYNDFIMHYANLLDGKVDGFCIGSEMIGLTKVHNGSHVYPAVNAFVGLAADVKAVLGGGVKVTYAADWSEYHHTDGGWYNLDPLWASANIDVVGIDAYFPLTDEPQTGYDKEKIIEGWNSGEGYEWYYTDEARTVKAPLTPQYAWKNIDWWWKHSHVNPDSNTTAWVPESKKIWFTEFGFPSVDGCSNQPNVFYDPNSSESSFPRFSKGRVDFRAQNNAIEATLDNFEGSEMVERLFLWCWDARPYPYYPLLSNVWADGPLWIYGHWVNGKLSQSDLRKIIAELCARSGMDIELLDLEGAYELVEGYVVDKVTTARSLLENLQKAYFFDATESGTKLKMKLRGNVEPVDIDSSEVVVSEGGSLISRREHELNLPRSVDVNYINKARNYLVGSTTSSREISNASGKDVLNLPIVLNEFQAKKVADVSLYNTWLARSSFEFSLPIKYAYLEPSDLVKIDGRVLKVVETMFGKNGEVKIRATEENPEVYNFSNSSSYVSGNLDIADSDETYLRILDINAPDREPKIRFAANGLGRHWKGAAIYRSDDGGVNYSQVSEVLQEAVQGSAASVLAEGTYLVFDEVSTVDILLLEGELESVTEAALLNGANIALVGDEILQFKNAVLIGTNKYRLSHLLRGRQGSEFAIGSHQLGERFVLLNNTIQEELVNAQIVGLVRKYKAVTFGADVADAAEVEFTFRANSLRPLAPCHVEATRSSGDINISFGRRTRIGGAFTDGAEVPLSEEAEKYEIDVLNGSVVVRTISATEAAATYTAAQQVADFGSLQASVEVRVYQISAVVGRGYGAAAIL